MGKMSDRAIAIEDLENLLEEPRQGNAEDILTVLQALRDLRPDAEIKGMPEVKRCPIIGELLGKEESTCFYCGNPGLVYAAPTYTLVCSAHVARVKADYAEYSRDTARWNTGNHK